MFVNLKMVQFPPPPLTEKTPDKNRTQRKREIYILKNDLYFKRV